ncbi:alpha/beta fold hydrolase [uncultured Hymenobacter sp.]|uniref:alpha/beta fold hydrolase n=1 Tax=uncultured Hymenobacter sp. TaxID=170016 RepID=UPI0035CC59FE
MKLYLIPGLGADGRLFAPLLPRLPATVRPQVLEWLPPAAPAESLASYAARLAAPILPNETCWVAGVSFGGIVALEIGRLRPRARIIQISSLSAAELLPLQLRLLRRLRLTPLASPRLLNWFPGVGNWFFGIQDIEMAKLLRSFMRQLDGRYLRWSLQALLHWDSRGVGPAVTLHGTRDRVFPLGRRQVDYQIPGGPHFMVYTHAEEVGAALAEILTAAHAS